MIFEHSCALYKYGYSIHRASTVSCWMYSRSFSFAINLLRYHAGSPCFQKPKNHREHEKKARQASFSGYVGRLTTELAAKDTTCPLDLVLSLSMLNSCPLELRCSLIEIAPARRRARIQRRRRRREPLSRRRVWRLVHSPAPLRSCRYARPYDEGVGESTDEWFAEVHTGSRFAWMASICLEYANFYLDDFLAERN